MIHSLVFDNQIKLWWEYENEFKEGCGFKVVKNGTEIITTDKYNISFKDLLPDTEYFFRVSLLNDSGIIVKEIGEIAVKTLLQKKKLDVTKPPYNATGDGKTFVTEQIQQAINDCKKDEKVFFPDGIYLTGALDLKSDIELELSDNAVIQGTTDETKYLPKVADRFEGNSVSCYRSLINVGHKDDKGGFNTRNIIIRGGSIIGGGDELKTNIIEREKEEVLKENGLENEINPPWLYAFTIPGRRRGRLIRSFNTQNIILADCKLSNGPAWNIHFVYSDNIVVCGCEVASHRINNGDGIDPDSSTNVTIFDVLFNTGDDCIAIKSGKNLEGYLIARPTKNVKIFDCSCVDGHGIAIGSEMSGGVDGVEIWNCDFSKSGTGLCIKTNEVRGGYVKNISVKNFKTPQIIVKKYSGNNDGDAAPVAPYVENLTFENVEISGISTQTGTKRQEKVTAIFISGYSDDNPVRNVRLKNVKMKYCALDPSQLIDIYYCENVTMQNVTCIGEPEEPKSLNDGKYI